MQHVVNIAFEFDDERIKKTLEDTTVEKVQKDIRQAVIDEVFSKSWSGSGWGRNLHADPSKDPLQEWVKREVINLLSDNKEYICKLAAKELAQSMGKSAKWKNMIVEEVKNNE